MIEDKSHKLSARATGDTVGRIILAIKTLLVIRIAKTESQPCDNCTLALRFERTYTFALQNV